MKRILFFVNILVLIFTANSVNAQFRGKHEIEIVYENFEKLYNKHDFYGEIYRYNQKNSSNKTLIQKINRGDFPQNGLKLDVNLSKNESVELKFYLSSKNKEDKIGTYHKTLTIEDIDQNNRISFELETSNWNKESYSTEEFMKFLASIIQTREQKAILDASLYSKLSSLPLGSYVFIDNENPQNIQKYQLTEYEVLEIDSTIPQSSLIMKYSKVVSKEKDGSVHASFSSNKIMANVESVIQSSDFVELSMNLDKFHREYIKNIAAVHFKYLTEDEFFKPNRC